MSGQRKVPLGRRGRELSGSQRRQPARLAWLNASEQTLNRIFSYSRRVSCRSRTLGVATAVRHR